MNKDRIIVSGILCFLAVGAFFMVNVELPPWSLPVRYNLHEQGHWLQGRHNSAGWSLLMVNLFAGAQIGAGDPCGAYGVLVQAAADLRCRRMDGVADLCDRQITTLRTRLGPERFDELLTEAQRRRRELHLYESERGHASAR